MKKQWQCYRKLILLTWQLKGNVWDQKPSNKAAILNNSPSKQVSHGGHVLFFYDAGFIKNSVFIPFFTLRPTTIYTYEVIQAVMVHFFRVVRGFY